MIENPPIQDERRAAPMPTVLDACCGGKMFWFDRNDERALFVDKRSESHLLKDSTSKHRVRRFDVRPDVIADFTALPFEEARFSVVVFDPPHLTRVGRESWMARKYGRLEGDWREMLRAGFSECFRVLKPGGVLVFKWAEVNVPVSEILDLTPSKPLVGQRCGKSAKTHWIVFLKDQA